MCVCIPYIYIKYKIFMIYITDTDVICLNISQRVIGKYCLFIFKEAVYRVLKV